MFGQTVVFGGIDLAKQVLALLQEKSSHFRFAYDHRLPLIDKINQVAKTIYGADGVDFSDTALARLKEFEKVGVDNLPICIAKTQYSLSDNAKLLGRPTGFRITVRDLSLSAGAGFVVVICGNIMKMPGLPEVPAASHIDVDDRGQIVGLF